MNDFLTNMKSFVLYKEVTKQKEHNKDKSIDNLEDELQLEMIKFKKAISGSQSPIKIENLNYKDYSSSISRIDSLTINASANIKDTLAKESSLSTLSSAALFTFSMGPVYFLGPVYFNGTSILPWDQHISMRPVFYNRTVYS